MRPLRRAAAGCAACAAAALVAQVPFPHVWWLNFLVLVPVFAAACLLTADNIRHPAKPAGMTVAEYLKVVSLRVYGDVRRLHLEPGDAVVVWTERPRPLSPAEAGMIHEQVRAGLRLGDETGLLILGAGQEIGVLKAPAGELARRLDDHLAWAATHDHPHEHRDPAELTEIPEEPPC